MSNGRTATTSTYCCFNAAAKTSFSALISPLLSPSHSLLFSFKCYSHTDFLRTIRRLFSTRMNEKSLMNNFVILFLNARFGLVCIFIPRAFKTQCMLLILILLKPYTLLSPLYTHFMLAYRISQELDNTKSCILSYVL